MVAVTRRRKRGVRTLIVDWWEGWGLTGRKARRSTHRGNMSANYDRPNRHKFKRRRKKKRS